MQFLREAQDRNPTSPVTSFSDEAMSLIIQAPWPGNVRELENAIERVVVLGREARITASDLAFLRENAPQGPSLEEDTSLTLKQMNQRYLQQVLARTHGDKVRAAEIMDINLSTLYRWEHSKGCGPAA